MTTAPIRSWRPRRRVLVHIRVYRIPPGMALKSSLYFAIFSNLCEPACHCYEKVVVILNEGKFLSVEDNTLRCPTALYSKLPTSSLRVSSTCAVIDSARAEQLTVVLLHQQTPSRRWTLPFRNIILG